MNKVGLKILLANPRGFCAGVDRAIQIVEEALRKFGAPVYVRHEIVHNRYVVESLEAKGAVFVDELDDIPDGVPVIFSAHGVPKDVVAEATRRGFLQIDATCPLVSKVHHEAERHHQQNHQVILIGHAGHPEVVGTMGQVPPGAMLLVEDIEQANNIKVDNPDSLAYVTQTTLSVDDAAQIVEALKKRFPAVRGPAKDDICFATTNRQQVVKDIAPKCDMLLVVGAPNSSNSKRLVEVAKRNGCFKAMLVQRASDIDWALLEGVKTLGITAGASAPEILVKEVLDAAQERFAVEIETIAGPEENLSFRLPPILA